MIVIHQSGDVVATVTREQICLRPRIEVLETDHPVRRWAVCQAVFGQHVLAGRIGGPYTPDRADLFVRHALLPDEAFCPFAELPDAWLAEYFNVPLKQVSEKRDDLRALAMF